MKYITLKYPGKCVNCGTQLRPGDRAIWIRRGQVCCENDEGCSESIIDDDYVQREISRRESAEYQKGKAEATQYLNDVATYGRDLAEQWEMEAEQGRYNRGED